MNINDILNPDTGFPKLYVTQPHECSYFPDRLAATILIDPKHLMTNRTYSLFATAGFRRSGQHVYRPRCPDCHACYSLRVPVDEFYFSRSQKRILKKNQHLQLEIQRASFIEDHYRLYRRYMQWRHPGGGMDEDDPEAYHRIFSSGWADTWMYCFKEGQQTVAVAITDHLENGISAVYTFYEPELAQNGLGTFAILQQIEQARKTNIPFVYLGYWVDGCDKMMYKNKFHPYQLFMTDEMEWKNEPLIF